MKGIQFDFKKYLAIFSSFFFFSCLQGQTKFAENQIKTSKTKISKEQSDLIYEHIKFFPNNTEFSIAVIKNGKVDFIGVKREKDTIKLNENSRSVFEIGSLTKVFTSSLLSDFVVRNDINLNDNIANYIDFNVNDKITFQELANHTSGLPRLPSNLNLLSVDQNNPYKDYDKEMLISYLTKEVELNQEPGIKYEYSNLGAGVLGFSLSELSGLSYEKLLQERIFEKFKMTKSSSLRAYIKSEIIKGLSPNGTQTSNWDFDALAGAGAILSNTEDLSKFALAQFDKNNTKLILTQKPTFKVNENMSVGLGWHILKTENEGELIWHNGGTGGYTSSMALDIDKQNGVIILSNVSAYHKKMTNIDKLCFELIETLN